MPELTVSERGWPGHYICAPQCLFRRNTLVSFGDIAIVVSSVGNLIPPGSDKIEAIGLTRYFETMAFLADDTKYKDAIISKPIRINSDWEVSVPDDFVANANHDRIVREIIDRLVDGRIAFDIANNLYEWRTNYD